MSAQLPLHSSRAEPLLCTVGIPVHRGMPWLREAVESLERQTCQEFAVLVVLDGPDPQSSAYLASVTRLNLRVIERPHRGLVSTLNHLLAECSTPWLVRQDADDISYPKRLQKISAAAALHPSAGLLCSRARYEPRGRSLGRFRSSHGSPFALRRAVHAGRLLSFCHSSVALNVATARAVGGYRSIPHSEDSDLWWRIALQADIHCLPEVLTGFRQHEQSISSVHHQAQQISGLYVQYLLLSSLWGLTPRPLEEIQDVLAHLLPQSATRARRSLRQANMALAHGHWFTAAGCLAQTLLLDPLYLPRRAWQEFSPQLQTNGLAPRVFWKEKHLLWT
jgi:glycosyltransferase involved in cell wall biosynthesis